DRVDAVTGDVPHHEQGVAVGQLDGAEPVAADVDVGLGGEVGDLDAQSGRVHRMPGQRKQGVLQPGDEGPLGAQHVVLGEDLPFALHQGQFGPAPRGQVLYEAVHVDRPAVGVGEG